MYRSQKHIGVFSAAMLGVGSMVGAGIFGLLGQAAAIAGSAVWVSFAISGVISLLSGISLARLGARYPSAGGLVEYLVQAFGDGLWSGALGLMLYLSGIVGMSLVARAFGAYGSAWLPEHWRALGTPVLATGIIFTLMLVNLEGAGSVAKLENLIVGAKFLVLSAFGIVGVAVAQPALLAPKNWPEPGPILSTLGLTFFAFSGYGVIANTAEDMRDPRRTLPRAMLLAIGSVIVIYLLVSVAVLGALAPEQVIASKDYALAAAARPVFGPVGFVLVSITALVSTASSLNANLYAVTNIGYQMSKNGELPHAFGEPIVHSREGLLFSSVLVVIFATTLDLGSIAAVGAVVVLIVQSVVHVGHLRLRRETGASLLLLLGAGLGTIGAACLALWRQLLHSPRTLGVLAMVIAGSFVVEFAMRRSGKSLRARSVPMAPAASDQKP